MPRVVLSLAALALCALPLSAQPPGFFRIAELKADGDKVAWTEMQYQTVQKEVAVTVNRNGVNVTEKRSVLETMPVTVKREVELSKLKATDAAGKAVDAKALAKRLKETTTVVIVTAPPGEKERKLFKDSTLFVQLPAPEVRKGPGPLPPPTVPAPVKPLPATPAP
jgi:hypothetical protein